MGVIALCLYLAVILLLTLRSRQSNAEASFFVNNRASGAVGVGLAIMAACVGASATIGMVGMAFSLGTPAFWWLGMGAAGLLLAGIFLAGKVRGTCAVTLPQIVEKFLGTPVRPVVSAVIVFAWLAILAAQFSAIRQIVTSLTAMPSAISFCISLLLIMGHTLGGGQAAVMRIGSVHTAVISGGLAVTLGWLTRRNPLWLSSVVIEPVNAQFPLTELARYGLLVGGSYLVCPMLFGRFLSARDGKTAQRGGILAAGGLICAAVLMVAIGLACRGILPPETPPDAVLTTALLTVLPQWVHILILVALLSAVISSADACLITAGTVLSRDLLQKESRAACRASIMLLGCIGAGASCLDKTILGFLLMSYDVYVCGVVMPVLIALLAGPNYRVAPRLACAAVFTGGVFGGISSFGGNAAWSYAGLAASFALTAAGLCQKDGQDSVRNNNP